MRAIGAREEMGMTEILRNALGPQSIFYPPYLLSALLITILWLMRVQKLTARQSLALLASRSRWLTRSSRADLLLWLFNLALVASALASCETWLFDRALDLTSRMTSHVPLTIGLPEAAEAIGATLVTMLAIDGISYYAHRLMHRSRYLWAIHAIHHSAENLTPLTTYRQHPLELLFLNGARVIAAGIALAIFHGFFKAQTPVWTVSGMGAGFFVYMFTVNLHHSFVPVRYPKWLRYVLVSPHVHHIHHSVEPHHQNRNFSVVFSFWDRLCHTYHDEEIGLQELRFGLGTDDRYRHSAARCIVQPVIDAGHYVLSVRSRLPALGGAGGLLLDPLAGLLLAIGLLCSGIVS
jgi:sterol desaturase/sphingolipid hydroxylase (fatty acid hydroxylase superfamily)